MPHASPTRVLTWTCSRFMQRRHTPRSGHGSHRDGSCVQAAYDHILLRAAAESFTSRMNREFLYEDVIPRPKVHAEDGTPTRGIEFGRERNTTAHLEPFPQPCGIVIEQDVYVGNGCCVRQGALSEAIAGKDTRIDNPVSDAHNCTQASIAQSPIRQIPSAVPR